MPQLSDTDLNIIFNEARTHKAWQDKLVSDEVLKQIYDTMKWGPTSSNCCPARILFVKSKEAKEKLKACVAQGNVEAVMGAPVTAIIAHDMEFYKKLPVLSPHNNAISWFEGKPDYAATTAFRNGTLQGAYFIIAARALGLDCGPMSGFDNAKVDEVFFAGTSWKSNFICNIGYGDTSKLYPRAVRLGFEEACRIE